jgi:hypothetical protein
MRVGQFLRSFNTHATVPPTKMLCYSALSSTNDRHASPMNSARPEKTRTDCRHEAQAIRAIAREMKNPKIQQQLLLIASLYDKLADIAEHADHGSIGGRPHSRKRGRSVGEQT